MKPVFRWTAIVALFIIPFLPLFVANGLFFPFITGKGFAFRILVEIALCAYVALAFLDRRYRPRFSWTLAAFAALVAWMAVADALGVNPEKAFWSNFERMDGWVMLAHAFAFFLVAGAILSADKLWKNWWLVMIGVSALVCGHGLLQLGGAAEIHQGGARVDASFGNAIYLAVYLMFMIAVTAWQAMASRGWLRYGLVALALLQALILFFTASRGALVGLAAGIGFAALLWLFDSRKEWVGKGGAPGARIAAGALVGLALFVGGFYLARDSGFVRDEPSLARLSSVFSLSEELKTRATIWGMALEGVKEDPLTGWGQEGFNQVFNKYYDPSLYRQEAWFDRAHNAYIDWLVAGGIPALVLFVALLLSALLALYREQGVARTERVIFAAAIVAYMVQALVVFDNLFSYVPLVALLAMAHAASARSVRRLDQAPEVSSEAGAAVLACVAGVAAVAIAWTVNVPSLRAAHHLVYAVSPAPGGPAQNLALFGEALADGSFASQEIREQLVSYAGQVAADTRIPADVRNSLASRALAEMGNEVGRSPDDARLRIQYASAFQAAGDLEGTLAQVDAAIALSPRKQALHIRRGSVLYDLGRTQEAQESFAYAYGLDRSFDEVAIVAAAGAILAGDLAGGQALLVEAVGTTTPDNDTLFYAYYRTERWDEFVAVAQARVAAGTGGAEARYRLAQAYAAAGRLEDARRELAAAMAQYPETRATGEALMKQVFVPAQ